VHALRFPSVADEGSKDSLGVSLLLLLLLVGPGDLLGVALEALPPFSGVEPETFLRRLENAFEVFGFSFSSSLGFFAGLAVVRPGIWI
jgi:hypothetical protein